MPIVGISRGERDRASVGRVVVGASARSARRLRRGRRLGCRRRRSSSSAVVDEVDARSQARRMAKRRSRQRPAGLESARVESAERIDELREARPAKAVLLAVLDAADHGLVDAGLGLEHALRPPQRQAPATDRGPDQVASRVARRGSAMGLDASVMRRHGSDRAAHTGDPAIRPRRTVMPPLASQPRCRADRHRRIGRRRWQAGPPSRDMPTIGIKKVRSAGRPKSSINAGSGRAAGRAPAGDRAARRTRPRTFRGSVGA